MWAAAGLPAKQRQPGLPSSSKPAASQAPLASAAEISCMCCDRSPSASFKSWSASSMKSAAVAAAAAAAAAPAAMAMWVGNGNVFPVRGEGRHPQPSRRSGGGRLTAWVRQRQQATAACHKRTWVAIGAVALAVVSDGIAVQLVQVGPAGRQGKCSGQYASMLITSAGTIAHPQALHSTSPKCHSTDIEHADVRGAHECPHPPRPRQLLAPPPRPT